jgi:hypothetical protein
MDSMIELSIGHILTDLRRIKKTGRLKLPGNSPACRPSLQLVDRMICTA